MDYEPQLLKELLDAAGGVELTGQEANTLKWLASWDKRTVDNIAAILRKARQAERETSRTMDA